MSSRQHSGLAPDRPDFVQLSVVRADSLVQNHGSYSFLGYIVKYGVDILGTFRIDFREVFLGLNLNSVHVFKSFKLVRSVYGLSHLRGCIFSYCSIDFFRRLVESHFLLRLANFSYNLFDKLYDFLDFLVSEKNCIKHFHFRNFVGSGFYHHDGVFGTGNCHVHVGFFPLLQSRVDNKLTVNSAYYYGACRAIPRNVRSCQCNG